MFVLNHLNNFFYIFRSQDVLDTQTLYIGFGVNHPVGVDEKVYQCRPSNGDINSDESDKLYPGYIPTVVGVCFF